MRLDKRIYMVVVLQFTHSKKPVIIKLCNKYVIVNPTIWELFKQSTMYNDQFDPTPVVSDCGPP